MTGAWDEVLISERGGGRARRLAVTAPQASWEINAAGSFSAFARPEDLRAAGLTRDLRGNWLSWTHPTIGQWGGVISGTPATDGLIEIAADGWLALLRGRVLNDGDMPARRPGGLAQLAILAAGRDAPTYVRIGVVENGGEPLGLTFSGDVADDLLPQIAEGGGIEWRIDADRVFTCARRLGVDRSARLRLVEGRHVVDIRTDDDLWTTGPAQRFLAQQQAAPPLTPGSGGGPTGGTLPGDLGAWIGLGGFGAGLGGFGGGADAGAAGAFGAGAALPVSAVATNLTALPLVDLGAQHAAIAIAPFPEGLPGGMDPEIAALVAENAAAVGWGTLQAVQAGTLGAFWNFPGGATGSGPAPAPPAWTGTPPGVSANSPMQPAIRYTPPPTAPMEMTLLPRDDMLGAFGVGDMVRVDAGSIGFRGRFRVLVMGVDAASGTLALAGEAMRD